jgi:putative ABC transport system permease protein
MESFIQDLKYGFRMLVKSPGFTAVAVVALALGIGANTAIFSVVNAVLLRSMPYRNADKIVLIWSKDVSHGEVRDQVSATDTDDLRKRSHSFVEVATFSDWTPILSGGDQPERIYGTQVGDGFFKVMDAQPLLGRVFLPEEQIEGKDQVVVLSYGLWRRRFGGDPGIVGRSITLSTRPHVVVGIMPASFRPLPSTLVKDGELYRPVAEPHDDTQRASRHLRAIARLEPEVSLRQAQAELDTLGKQFAAEFPQQDSNIGFRAVTLFEDTFGDVRPILVILLGAVVLVLLIACANVANLLLARSTARQKEIAIRMALGAGRTRLVRQMLTESLALASLGGAVGVMLAMWSTSAINAFSPKVMPQLGTVDLDARVLAFAAVVSVATGIVFGLAPALQLSALTVNETLKEGGRTSLAGGSRLRSVLVASEIAMALVLLIGAGLLLKSFQRLLAVHPGFATENRVVMNVWLPYAKYNKADTQVPFFRELVRRVEALPGVRAAGIVSTFPMTNFDRRGFRVEGRQYAPGRTEEADAYMVNPDYLGAMGIPLLRGRNFTEQDDSKAQQVVIVGQIMAQRLWPGQDAVGKRILLPGRNDEFRAKTVIGVVGDVKQYTLDRQTSMELYFPYGQESTSAMTLVVHTNGDAMRVVPAVRDEVRALDPDQAIFRVQTLAEIVADTVASRRVSMLLIGLFAAIALVLGAVGIYGVVSYGVTQRTHEIGIRMALGARPSDVLRLVVGQGSALAATGIAVGLVVAFAVTRVLTTMLFAVSATDPFTFASVALLLGAVALLASYIPARRATRVDPMVALRYE